ncbi:MAG: hypothetical protein LKE30_01940 [Bacteroidales bacterium]|jgi:hypothetical protein|nr:hypothetical protein [Bacteroidales bacterium]
MKKHFILTSLIICCLMFITSNNAFCQSFNESNEENNMPQAVVKATYPGGEKAINNIVMTNFPKEVLQEYNGQTLKVRFFIDETGVVYRTEVENDEGYHFSNYIKNCLSKMQKWTPAKDRLDKNTASFVDVPIKITIKR